MVTKRSVQDPSKLSHATQDIPGASAKYYALPHETLQPSLAGTHETGVSCTPSTAAQVDAFADGPGSGNPAGVCLLEGTQLNDMTDKVRQKVAEKVNLSETAFLEPVSW